jgi:hypothetical protein
MAIKKSVRIPQRNTVIFEASTNDFRENLSMNKGVSKVTSGLYYFFSESFI